MASKRTRARAHAAATAHARSCAHALRSGRFQRVVQTSTDGGKSWRGARHDPTLIEPEPQGCQGSLLVTPSRPAGGGGVLFFCNPSSSAREMLTVRRSDDGGASWGAALLLEEGPAAYSSLAYAHDGHLLVLYERGRHHQISLARIPSAPDGPLGEF